MNVTFTFLSFSYLQVLLIVYKPHQNKLVLCPFQSRSQEVFLSHKNESQHKICTSQEKIRFVCTWLSWPGKTQISMCFPGHCWDSIDLGHFRWTGKRLLIRLSLYQDRAKPVGCTCQKTFILRKCETVSPPSLQVFLFMVLFLHHPKNMNFGVRKDKQEKAWMKICCTFRGWKHQNRFLYFSCYILHVIWNDSILQGMLEN